MIRLATAKEATGNLMAVNESVCKTANSAARTARTGAATGCVPCTSARRVAGRSTTASAAARITSGRPTLRHPPAGMLLRSPTGTPHFCTAH